MSILTRFVASAPGLGCGPRSSLRDPWTSRGRRLPRRSGSRRARRLEHQRTQRAAHRTVAELGPDIGRHRGLDALERVGPPRHDLPIDRVAVDEPERSVLSRGAGAGRLHASALDLLEPRAFERLADRPRVVKTARDAIEPWWVVGEELGHRLVRDAHDRVLLHGIP